MDRDEMVKNREIRVRVTKDQLERIQMNAQAKGFKTVSGYLRSLCLEHNRLIEDKILENNRMLREMMDNLSSGEKK